jgi:hypothetical protein
MEANSRRMQRNHTLPTTATAFSELPAIDAVA